MDIIDAFDISSSGLLAERLRLEAVSSNLANARTTKTENGGPYQRRVPVFETEPARSPRTPGDNALVGVRVARFAEVKGEQRVYDPTHPDAGPDGYVAYPDIDVLHEMVDMMTASRAYEANAAAVETTRDLAMRALEIGR